MGLVVMGITKSDEIRLLEFSMRSWRLLALWVLIPFFIFSPATLDAQFSDPEQVSPAGIVMSQPWIEVDKSCQDCLPPFLTFSAHSDSQIYFGGPLVGGNTLSPIFSTPQGIGQLVHKQGSLASIHMAFDLPVTPTQRAIFVSQRVASGFELPVQYSSGLGDSVEPSVTSLLDGTCLGSWTENGQTGQEILFRLGSNPETSLGVGHRSEVARLGSGLGAVLWNQDGFFRYLLMDTLSQGPILELYDFGFNSDQWRSVTLLDGSIHLVTVSGSTLHFLTADLLTGVVQSVGSYRSPGGSIEDLELDSIENSSWTATWIQDGTVRSAIMNLGVLQVEETGIAASQHSQSLDVAGNIHLLTLRNDGSIHYQNSIPAPDVAFTLSSEGSGVAPHTIQFESLSTGMISSYLWDFGDGNTSTEASGSHTYFEPGEFSVTLTATGPGGTSQQQFAIPVTVTAPGNYMKFADISVFGGQPVYHPVLGTHVDPLQGYQIGVAYDGTFLEMSEVSIAGTQAAQLSPEFIISNIFPDGADSSLYLAVIFDTLPPFDGRTVQPGVNHTLCTLNYEVTFGQPLGSSTELRFTNGIGFPPINTIYAIEGGLALEPYFIHGTVLVSEQPQFLFIRGDATYDQTVNIADAIFMLEYLFVGGSEAVCPDSADTNDDGILNIGDAIYSLSYLFSSGETIPYPYPGYGLDPTEDNLGPCLP